MTINQKRDIANVLISLFENTTVPITLSDDERVVLIEALKKYKEPSKKA